MPVQSAVGAGSNYEMVSANIAYDATAIYRGDPVMMMNTGYIEQWDAGTAARLLFGVFWGCWFLSSQQGKLVPSSFWPGSGAVASTAQESIYATIIPIKGAGQPLFRVQSDATGVVRADIGLNVEITPGTGSALDGSSGAYASGIADTNTLPFQIVGLYGGSQGAGGVMGITPSDTNPYGGSATGAYAQMIVRANTIAAQGI